MATELTIGPYRLNETRATSVAGHEYAATDMDLGVRVLLTVVDSLSTLEGQGATGDLEVRRAFHQLMDRLSELDHPLLGMPRRVCPQTSDQYWYTSMPTDGTSLRRHVQQHGPFGWRTVALLIHELCVALAFAHKRSIPHGNIEPGTVLVEPNGAVRLVRPDVAGRIVARSQTSSTVSLASLWDEPVYLSPDVLNRREPTPGDDIYALGVLAFELVTGRLPYANASEPLGRFQSRRSAPDLGEHLEGVPESFRRLVRSMMAPRSAIRIPTATALRAEIKQQLLPNLGATAGRSELLSSMRTRPSRGSSSPASAESGVDRTAAELAVDKALTAAGMVPQSESRPDIARRRGLFVALGVGVVGAALLFTVARPGSSLEESASRPGPALRSATGQANAAPQAAARGVVPSGAVVEQAPSPPVDPVEVARLKAESLLSAKQYTLAERVLRRAMKEGHDGQGVLGMMLGQALQSQGRVKEAIRVYVAADGPTGTRTAGHVKAGVLIAVDGRCPEALPIFLEAAARTEASAEILKHVGNCQLIVGDLRGAVETLKQAYVADHEDLDIVVPLAQTLEKLEDLAGAAEMYRQALSLKPGDRRARLGLARIEGSTGGGDMVQRVEAILPTPTADAVDTDALEVKAHAAFRSGQFAKASKLYGQAADALGAAASPSLLRNLAVSLHKAGQGFPAIRAYEAAVAAAPDDAELHYLMGMLLVSERRDSAASQALSRALELEPGRTKARFELGLVALRRGRHRDAARTFQDVVRQQPANRAAWQNLVKARLDGGDNAGALDALGQMHTAFPGETKTLLTMAALLQTMDRDDEATALLTEACSKGVKEACR